MTDRYLAVAAAGLRHHDLRRDVGARRRDRRRSTSARASPTPTARRGRRRGRDRRRSAPAHNQYPPGLGIPELRAAIAEHQRRWYGLDVRPRHRGARHRGRHRGDRRRAARAVRAGRRGRRRSSRTTTPTPPASRWRARTRRVVTLRPPDYAFDPDALRAAITPRTRVILLNSPHNPTGKVFTARRARARSRRSASSTTCIVVTDEVYEHLVFDGVSTCPLATLPGMRERTVTISSARQDVLVHRLEDRLGVRAGPSSSTAVRTAKQFLTYVNGAPFQHAVAVGLGLPDDYFRGFAADLRAPSATCSAAGWPTPGFDGVPVGRHLLRHRRHPAARRDRRPRVLPVAARALRRGRGARASCSTTTRTRAGRWCASRSASAGGARGGGQPPRRAGLSRRRAGLSG